MQAQEELKTQGTTQILAYSHVGQEEKMAKK